MFGTKRGVMETRDLCQELFDHVVAQLPEDREAALGLAALGAFHPAEVGFFIAEAVALLVRHGQALPPHLAVEVNKRMVSATQGQP